MTNSQVLRRPLNLVFDFWEKNRMYPLAQRVIPMATINDSHLKAVARATHFVRSGITRNMTPKLISSIELDLKLLDEVHRFCRQQIEEPGLPMSPVSTGPDDIGVVHGNESSESAY